MTSPSATCAVVALIAGILILIMPRLLNYIVAIYLIVIGIIGLGIHQVRPADAPERIGCFRVDFNHFLRRLAARDLSFGHRDAS